MSFPETAEELEEFFQGFFEAYKEQKKSAGDFQQEFSTPQIPKDMMMFYRDKMTAAGGYSAFTEHQIRDLQDQINHYNQMTSCIGETICSDQMKIQACKHCFHVYQTSGYRGNQNFFVDPQMARPFGGQSLNDCQMQTPVFDTIYHGNTTNFSEEWNMFQGSGTTGNCKDTFYVGQRIISVDVSILPDQKRLSNVEGSHSPQMASFGSQTPYVDTSICPSSSFVVESQPPESFSASPSVQGGLSQEKSDRETQSHTTQKKPSTLKFYSCPYPDCGKSYRKSFNLKEHMKKHTGEKPYACDKPGCSWKFSRSEDLKRHKTKHSGERPHPCAKCNRRFSRLYYLKQHQKVCIQGQASSGI